MKERRNSKELKHPLFGFMMILTMMAGVFLLNGCGEDPVEEDKLSITGISIPAEIYIEPEESLVLTAKGFEAGDRIKFTLATDHSVEFLVDITTIGDFDITLYLPEGFESGTYTITVIRGDESQILGTVSINITSGSEVPDVEGMTVKGIVYCNGEGVPGVVVSDGLEVTVTDEEGIYYLPSDKENEYVFISVPGNYEVANDVNLPLFFKRLAGGSTVERKDFSLIEADNSEHILIAMADWHLANRNGDVAQFSSGFLADVNALIAGYETSGKKVYGLTLGDLTWDLFWYSNLFALPEYLVQMKKVNCTVFNVIGNHDNDPYIVGDWDSQMPFRDILGPNYYSFNLGDVHYIVLDNIVYLNSGASQGVVGSRNYNATITADQLTWLERDLATIEDKNTPIVIAMHIPMYKQPSVNVNGEYASIMKLSNGYSILSLIEPFSNVDILTGHSHKNYTVEPQDNLMEHNVGAVCATWWWTGKPGYAGNHICPDGSPGGYAVWEVEGTEQEWYYKSCGYEKEYQFRSYDLNSTLIDAETFAPNSTDELLAEYAGEYATPSVANEILINVWNWDLGWTISVTENGNELDISQVNKLDPLHIISYEALRLNVGATPGFVTDVAPHFFMAKASSATSKLEISVTDCFGNVYTESMSRPKELTYDMR